MTPPTASGVTPRTASTSTDYSGYGVAASGACARGSLCEVRQHDPTLRGAFFGGKRLTGPRADGLVHVQYSMLYESQYHVPSYGAYYENGTKPWRALHRLRSYEYVRDLLKVRQWRTREDADRKDKTFVLKSPMHLECADALLHMLPTQGFPLVRMHREPLNVVLSLATMLAYIQALQSDQRADRVKKKRSERRC